MNPSGTARPSRSGVALVGGAFGVGALAVLGSIGLLLGGAVLAVGVPARSVTATADGR
ncbi:hypothetical protein ACFVVU_27875 [Kitasatospora sp. NPDC057965]|uniref:hypothetical protein n=1 Tax=Kitasatospora sp. NPDC057965 TaxID=3346291 RepID=UPI0036D7610F